MAQVLPNAILYDAAFSIVLGLILELEALIPPLRRNYFALILMPTGFVEYFIVGQSNYSIPLELSLFGIPFVTILSGIIVTGLYAARHYFDKKKIRLLLVFSGCLEIALGAFSFLHLDLAGFPYQNSFTVWSVNYQSFFLGTLLSTVGVYSFVVGSLFMLLKTRRANLSKVATSALGIAAKKQNLFSNRGKR